MRTTFCASQHTFFAMCGSSFLTFYESIRIDCPPFTSLVEGGFFYYSNLDGFVKTSIYCVAAFSQKLDIPKVCLRAKKNAIPCIFVFFYRAIYQNVTDCLRVHQPCLLSFFPTNNFHELIMKKRPICADFNIVPRGMNPVRK